MNFQRVFRRPITTMATQMVSPFTQAVVGAMRKLYPEKLADGSFDNTGLLLEAPYRPGHLKNSVLLTIDLTKAVADEAIARKDSIIVTYHPIIFRPLKAITHSNSQQSSLLRLAQEGISVYSPHTAVDAAPGGLNDFLADIVGQAGEVQDRSVIIPVKEAPAGFEAAGYGRIVKFTNPVSLKDIVTKTLQGLSIKGVSLAVPQWVRTEDRSQFKISSVGICAGSGGSMLNGLDVDLLFTGELSHHEALAAIEQGKCVITTFHSNSERQFLRSVLHGQLQNTISDHVKNSSKEEKELWDGQNVGQFEVGISDADRDPFQIVTSTDSVW